MLKFSEFLVEETLLEKQIVFNNNARYGQVVFLAGGAGSGKGFVIKNYMNGNLFKIRDVDEWKKAFMKIGELKNKYSEIQGLDLKNPRDVFSLHKFITNLKVKDKTLELMLRDAKEDRLPNIIFDITAKDVKDITNVIPLLQQVGYKATDMHLVWVLTDYSIAVQQNKTRERVVPDDILLKTHEGAASTMYNILRGQIPSGLDGDIVVVINNANLTVFYLGPDGKPYKGAKGEKVVKDFLYFRVKNAGGNINDESYVMRQVHNWMKKNAPKTLKTADIHSLPSLTDKK